LAGGGVEGVAEDEAEVLFVAEAGLAGDDSEGMIGGREETAGDVEADALDLLVRGAAEAATELAVERGAGDFQLLCDLGDGDWFGGVFADEAQGLGDGRVG